MTLGQSMMVIVAMALLGFLALSANSSVMESTDISDTSDFGVTAVSLATSIIQEAMAKDFDETVSTTGNVSDSSAFTPVGSLGPEPGERYRDAAHDFNDFDDFNNLFLCYTSPLDPTPEPGADSTVIVSGIRARYLIHVRVDYVSSDSLMRVSPWPTWNKRMIVSVTRPVSKDTVKIPAVMSYWN